MGNIGERIKEARLRNDWSQEELAKKMGYKSKSTINKIELGINDVTQKKVAKFPERRECDLFPLCGLMSSLCMRRSALIRKYNKRIYERYYIH